MTVALDQDEISAIRARVEPAYDVVEAHFGFEVRAYRAAIQVRTTVRGGYRENLGDGLRLLASYLFGGNRTADGASVSIDMTPPIAHVDRGDVSVISVSLPGPWTP